ncbi:CBS domain-containing protein [Sphingomonas sp.]|jgi:CBS domain-containing protein|uniref:CBS domain-containing protein n=1 Tax=Sphingomonas sp. TaxID=28214 RepID=UPI0035C7AF7F
MTIASILSGKGAQIFSVTPDTPVTEVVALLAEKRIGAVPVVDDGGVRGIFSERDVIRLLASGGGGLGAPVSSAMTAPAVTVTPGESVIGALSLMTRRRIRHLPVVDGGRVIGFVSIGDLVKYRIDRIEAEAMAMRAYIQQA